jgi:hypothetical protein
MIFNKHIYPFHKEELDEIIQLSPLNYDNNVQYKAFFNGIKRLGKPKTSFSIKSLLRNSTEFYEKYSTLSSENFFSLKKRYELNKYELRDLNIKELSTTANQESLEGFNNQAIIENFLTRLCRDFLKTIKAVYPKQELTETLLFKAMGVKPFEKANFLQP